MRNDLEDLFHKQKGFELNSHFWTQTLSSRPSHQTSAHIKIAHTRSRILMVLASMFRRGQSMTSDLGIGRQIFSHSEVGRWKLHKGYHNRIPETEVTVSV